MNNFRKNHEIFMAQHQSYVGIVPLLEDTKLSCQARVLFHIISSFSFKEGYCFATNRQLALRLGLKETMVKKYLGELIKEDILISEINPTSYGFRRRLHINFDHLRKRYLKVEKVRSNFRNSSPSDLRSQYHEYDQKLTD